MVGDSSFEKVVGDACRQGARKRSVGSWKATGAYDAGRARKYHLAFNTSTSHFQVVFTNGRLVVEGAPFDESVQRFQVVDINGHLGLVRLEGAQRNTYKLAPGEGCDFEFDPSFPDPHA